MKTGNILSMRLSEEENEHFSNNNDLVKVIIDEKKHGVFTLARIFEPYQRVRIRDDGRIEYSDLVGKNSFFSFEEVSVDEIYLKSTVKTKDQSVFYYIFPQDGTFISSTTPRRVKYQIEHLAIESLLVTVKSEPIVLDPWLKRRFVHEGFLHIPAGITRRKAIQCQRLLMHHLGIPNSIVPGGAQDGLGKLSGSLSNSLEVRNLLLDEKILSIVADLMGGLNNIDSLTNLSAQIALRFPELSPSPLPIRWHTDGLRQGRTHGFSLLVGVCLSDVVEEDAGNLLVWPGTHVPIHQSTIGDEGAIDTDLLSSLLQSQRLGSSSSSSVTQSSSPSPAPPEGTHHNNEPNNLPDLGKPYQLLAQLGDAVILHPDTAHTGGPNSSSSIRSMVYFRLKHRNLKENDESYRGDMWIDLPGVFETTAKTRR